MNASKVGLGAVLLAASGLTLEATGQPGAGLPLALAGLAAMGLVGYLLTGQRRDHLPR
jgi:hypothetical protein